MYEAELFPQIILNHFQGRQLLLHGRLTTHRNDGCWFVVIQDSRYPDKCEVIVLSPFEDTDHEIVDSGIIPVTELFGWLECRINY